MQSMDKIYQQYAQMVYKYLLSRTCNPELAEELTQETFYQAIRTIDRFDESCQMSTWLCAIAKNVYYTWLRKHPEHGNLEEHVKECERCREILRMMQETTAGTVTFEEKKEIDFLKKTKRVKRKRYGEVS